MNRAEAIEWYLKPALVGSYGQYIIGSDSFDSGKAMAAGGSLQIAIAPVGEFFLGIDVGGTAYYYTSDKSLSIPDRETFPLPVYGYSLGAHISYSLFTQLKVFVSYFLVDEARNEKVGGAGFKFAYVGTGFNFGADYKLAGSKAFIGLELIYRGYTKFNSQNPTASGTNLSLSRYLVVNSLGVRLGYEF